MRRNWSTRHIGYVFNYHKFSKFSHKIISFSGSVPMLHLLWRRRFYFVTLVFISSWSYPLFCAKEFSAKMEEANELIGLVNKVITNRKSACLIHIDFNKDQKYHYPEYVIKTMQFPGYEPTKHVDGTLLRENAREFYVDHTTNRQTAVGNLASIASAYVQHDSPGEILSRDDLTVFNSLVDQTRALVTASTDELKTAAGKPPSAGRLFFDRRLGPGYFTIYANNDATIKLLENLEKQPTLASNYRLVLTPSYLRSNLESYMSDSHDALWKADSSKTTLHILVTRQYESLVYAGRYCPKGFIVAAMPGNEEGVGSARFWSMELASMLNFEWTWMIDDSIRTADKAIYDHSKNTYKPLLFGVKLVEQIRDSVLGSSSHVGIFSLRRYTSHSPKADKLGVCYSQGFQLINCQAVRERNVFFWRGLDFGEDFLFSAHCLDAKLLVLRLNHFDYVKKTTKDHGMSGTGAHEPRSQIPDFRLPLLHKMRISETEGSRQSGEEEKQDLSTLGRTDEVTATDSDAQQQTSDTSETNLPPRANVSLNGSLPQAPRGVVGIHRLVVDADSAGNVKISGIELIPLSKDSQ